VSPSLVAGEQITVHLQGCGGNWTEYGPFAVLAGPPPPPVFAEPGAAEAGWTFCMIYSKAAGSIIDVYTATNHWLGSAISVGNLDVTTVFLSSPLQLGEQLHCTQTLCGVHGDATPNVTVTKQHPKAPVLLQPPNGAHNVDLLPVFQWQDPGAGTPASADAFHIQAMPGTAVDATVPGPSFQPAVPLTQASNYQWQVTAINSGGQATSAMFSFETKLPPTANLHFNPPIDSNVVGHQFPRGPQFAILIHVVNSGNGASLPYSVSFQALDTSGNNLVTPVIGNFSSLNAGDDKLVYSDPVVLPYNNGQNIKIVAKLFVNNQQIDMAYRIV
jgi:hypothetical protein